MFSSTLKCLVTVWSLALLVPSVHSQAVKPLVAEQGVGAYPFDISQVRLTPSRWLDNQGRTLTYLKWVDMDRLLYVFRVTHKLPTNGAAKNGGWDAPTWRFRGHIQGHLMTAWSQCYSQLGDPVCRERALTMVKELAKCQANPAGFKPGYLMGFPESEFDELEQRNGTIRSGNVPWYVVHKTMAGLLDVWRTLGDKTAEDVLLKLASWADIRTKRLPYATMQSVLKIEFGGVGAVMVDLYYQTGDKRWLDVAARFDHAAVIDPLSRNQDRLLDLHANTQIPKWLSAIREFKATGKQRYKDIAANAWQIVINAHTYSIGGNSQGEAFRAANMISKQLTGAVNEGCNSYNMLKLTRELWSVDANASNTTYFDYYERTLLNHLLGQQNPHDPHGHVTYYTDLKPGGKRGHGPDGKLRYTDDYDSFWCCQGTGTETNTKFADSVYWRDGRSLTLYVNLFTPSVLSWRERGVVVTQRTGFPTSDVSKIKVMGGGGEWTMKIRIPFWTFDAKVLVNGKPVEGVRTGKYASISRTWVDGDEVQIQLPMKLWTMAANDRRDMATLFYGPTVLSGNYGNQPLQTAPTLDLSSIKRVEGSGLQFTGMADGKPVSLSQFYDAHGHTYNVYWVIKGSLPVSRTISDQVEVELL
ncbi:secreted protein [Microthyrium microscopicum]|uniref:Secreted protein n=1 Tax=Microthyrium microscopicum TaxID=703497 RepID=A0A6A6TY19_9PEZI|nr:secreted protein [Microthyrium microscopicum]